jgi:antitoxin component of RelBE/YafQ-DinJ toxin-antitoxin module
MRIESTINMDKQYVQKITSVCEEFSFSRSQLIALLLKRFFKEQQLPRPCSMFQRVTYQQRREKKKWKIIHMSFDPDLFERCHDVRKFCKISVSRFIALAIDLYLDIIVEDRSETPTKNNITDNYQHNYLFFCNNAPKITTYSIFWGMPDLKRLETQFQAR